MKSVLNLMRSTMKKMLLILIGALVIGGCKFNNEDNSVAPPDETNDIIMPGIVQNGDFEETDNNTLPKYWTTNITGSPQFNFFNLDNSQKESGQVSLKVNFIDSLSYPDPQYGSWGGLYQNISINEFIPGQKYFLRFWVRVDVGKVHVRIVKNGDMEKALLSYVVPAEKKWVEYKIGFTTDSETSFMWLVVNTKPALAENGNVSAWVDNFRVSKL